jgi:hypothetical protein
MSEKFETDAAARGWIEERSTTRGVPEDQAHHELLELGYLLHKGGGSGARLKELGVTVIGTKSDGYVDLEGSSGM